jgi:hypothetical protein
MLRHRRGSTTLWRTTKSGGSQMPASRSEFLEPDLRRHLPSAAADLCEVASSLVVANEAQAVSALEVAARIGGAEAALFVWVIPQGDEHHWFRSIAALDHRWGASVLQGLHEGPCAWLAHAARSSEPLLVRVAPTNSCADSTSADNVVEERAAWLVPAPSPQSSDALGLLILTGTDELRLEVTKHLLPVYRALALALAEWFQRRAREELVQQAHLTDRDLDLLRREWMGHGSKRIAAALNAEPKTIDCRFHRLNVRLGVATRRDAVRLCRRYGLF